MQGHLLKQRGKGTGCCTVCVVRRWKPCSNAHEECRGHPRHLRAGANLQGRGCGKLVLPEVAPASASPVSSLGARERSWEVYGMGWARGREGNGSNGSPLRETSCFLEHPCVRILSRLTDLLSSAFACTHRKHGPFPIELKRFRTC